MQPAFEANPAFIESGEGLVIEKLVTEAGVEHVDIAIFPRASRLDVGGL